MSNVFKEQDSYSPKRPRNNFGPSFTNNFTTKLGQITPIFCKETIPGDTFSIDSSIGLRALPMVFPIQTPIIAEVEAYYIPVRVVWKDFKDFVFDNKKFVHPYLSIPWTRASEIGTGTLADYLNIPTTYAGAYGGMFSVSLLGFSSFNLASVPDSHVEMSQSGTIGTDPVDPSTQLTQSTALSTSISSLQSTKVITPYFIDKQNYDSFQDIGNSAGLYAQVFAGYLSNPIRYIPTKITFNHLRNIQDGTYDIYVRVYGCHYDSNGDLTDNNSPYISTLTDGLKLNVTSGVGEIDIPDDRQDELTHALSQNGEIRLFIFDTYNSGQGLFPIIDRYSSYDTQTISGWPQLGSPMYCNTNENMVGDVDPTLNPFVVQNGETVPAIPLSIIPFRCMEAIYNRYKRNNFLNPLRVYNPDTQQMEVEYNRYCTNLDSGADSTTPISLMNRNYELDYLTDARLTPQQGIAPLVGVNASGQIKFEDQNGNIYEVDPELNADGDLITGIQSYTNGMPEGSLKQLEEMISYGISLNTLRSASALQVWLEDKSRQGFRYEEQMFSLYHINVSNLELTEPIFIGGYERRFTVEEITALAKSEGVELGEYAGKASLMTTSKHSINYTCQEHGFIIMTLTITPIPCYSQLLPKYWLKSSPLDYFSPTFNHLSYQPITYKEVCPIQAFASGDDLDDVFGYQRPYYDLVANVDECHSRMRTDLQNYLLTRVFGSKPLLSQDFIEVDPKDLTSPFVDTNANADNFLGQVYFRVYAKRQVSKIAVARLTL